jgi:hypothetical protein
MRQLENSSKHVACHKVSTIVRYWPIGAAPLDGVGTATVESERVAAQDHERNQPPDGAFAVCINRRARPRSGWARLRRRSGGLGLREGVAGSDSAGWPQIPARSRWGPRPRIFRALPGGGGARRALRPPCTLTCAHGHVGVAAKSTAAGSRSIATTRMNHRSTSRSPAPISVAQTHPAPPAALRVD